MFQIRPPGAVILSITQRMPRRGFGARLSVERAAGLSKRQILIWLFNLQKLDARLKRAPSDRGRQLMETTLLESLAGRYLSA